MPELPEVETVRRGLAPALVGRRIKRARTKRADHHVHAGNCKGNAQTTA